MSKRTHSRLLGQSENDDIIYYNFNIVNNNNFPIPCAYSDNAVAPLLENARDYLLTVVRFVLDGSTIPIFIFKGNTYTVSCTLNGANVFTLGNPNPYLAVEYIPYDRKFLLDTVFSYQAFLEMINVTLKAFHTEMLLTTALGPTPAFMDYDATTGLCDLYVPETYYTFNVKIYFNTALYGFFNNFLSQFYGNDTTYGRDYEIIIKPQETINTKLSVLAIPTGYFRIQQEFSSLSSWFDITSIVFESNTLGVKSEYTPTQNLSKSVLSSNNNAGSGPAVTPLMTDFQPYYDPTDKAGPRGYLYYTPSGPYRLINMDKDKVQQLDVNIKLRDRVGNTYQYYVPPNQSVQIKIGFLRKDLYKAGI